MNREEIYLQIDNSDDLPVTWAEDKIYDTDVMYILAEKANKLLKEAYEVIWHCFDKAGVFEEDIEVARKAERYLKELEDGRL